MPNDGLLDINEGTDISLTIIGGDFSADKDTETDIVINHANITRSPDTTSSVGPNHGGTFTTIDSITSSATGHITVANLKTVTLPNGANDNTITLSAGTYLSGGGDFTVDQSFDETLTINHDSTTRSDTTSTVSPAHGANFTAVDSVTTNATGHITSVNLKTITLPNDNNTDILQRISADSTNAERYVTFVNSATGNLEASSDATFRFNPSTNKLTVTNLEVTGTQTINNVEVINTSGGIVFEGSVDDVYETTFNVINPTADRAINLPNKSGTVALTDDIETYDLSVSSSGTPASIDLDLVNSGGTDIVVVTGGGAVDVTLNSAQQFTISHADTSSQSSVNNSGNTFIQDITVDTYGHITGITSGTATDNDTITQIREDNGSYRTGSITLQSGTNVNITEPSIGVFNFASTDTQPNNGLLDINQGSGISLAIGGGDFTADKATTTTIDISHADTSSQSSVNNTGNAFIQDITLDTYGHVTGLNSTTVSIGNGTLTVQGTGALGGSGTFTANQSGNTDIYISHDDTSALNGTYGSTANNTKIDTITVDAYGHVTAIATGPIDDNNNIDYINSASFNTGNGILTLSGVGNAGASVDLDGRYVLDTGDTVTGTLRITGTSSWLTAEGNVGGTTPPFSQGLALGWNRSNGSRESEILWHPGNATHADGELYFRSYNGSSYVTVLELKGDGSAKFHGALTIEGCLTTGDDCPVTFENLHVGDSTLNHSSSNRPQAGDLNNDDTYDGAQFRFDGGLYIPNRVKDLSSASTSATGPYDASYDIFSHNVFFNGSSSPKYVILPYKRWGRPTGTGNFQSLADSNTNTWVTVSNFNRNDGPGWAHDDKFMPRNYKVKIGSGTISSSDPIILAYDATNNRIKLAGNLTIPTNSSLTFHNQTAESVGAPDTVASNQPAYDEIPEGTTVTFSGRFYILGAATDRWANFGRVQEISGDDYVDTQRETADYSAFYSSGQSASVTLMYVRNKDFHQFTEIGSNPNGDANAVHGDNLYCWMPIHQSTWNV